MRFLERPPLKQESPYGTYFQVFTLCRDVFVGDENAWDVIGLTTVQPLDNGHLGERGK